MILQEDYIFALHGSKNNNTEKAEEDDALHVSAENVKSVLACHYYSPTNPRIDTDTQTGSRFSSFDTKSFPNQNKHRHLAHIHP